ncbi:MAG: hypothetical protein ACREFP_02930 [Acetobacteraceae bacterium]
MSDTYDKTDPRIGRIEEKFARRYGPKAAKTPKDDEDEKAYLSRKIRTIVKVDRSSQATETDYHAAIQSFGVAMAKDSQIGFQTYECEDINAGDIMKRLSDEPNGWVHFIKVTDPAASRLYVPCRLDAVSVSAVCNVLWSYPQVLRFKIVGYGNATHRADVIVAWFAHAYHALAMGAILENLYSDHLMGDRPVGSYRCTMKGMCGWAPEVGSSVGMDIRRDILAKFGLA